MQSVPKFIEMYMLQEKQKIQSSLTDTAEGTRMHKLGFTSKTIGSITPSSAKVLIEYFNVYNQYYPNNRFVNFACMQELLVKYNLVIGDPSKYIADIPKFALDTMEKFKTIPYFSYEESDSKVHYNPKWAAKVGDGYGDTYSMENLFFMSHTSMKNTSIIDIAKDFESANKTFLLFAPESHFIGSDKKDVKPVDQGKSIVLSPVDGGYIVVCIW